MSPMRGTKTRNTGSAMSWRGRRGIDDDDAAFFGESVHKRLKSADEAADDEVEHDSQQSAASAGADDDEIDPLDAFMAGIESSAAKAKPNFKGKKAERIEVEDAVDVYMQQRRKALDAIARDPQLAALLASRGIDLKDEAVAELGADEIRALLLDDGASDGAAAATAGASSADDEDAEEDRLAELGIEALDVEALKKSKIVPILAPIDHAAIDYPDFNKEFLVEHAEIKALDGARIAELRRALDVRVSGADVPAPAASFAHFSFDEALMKEIRRAGFERPTPIQCQAVPIALSGRDMIGIAKTGSGKTAAFLWPMLIHIMDQYELQKGDGPIGLIVAPTRELSDQIYIVAKQFAKGYGIKVAPIFGGAQNKFEQFKMLKGGCEIVVCTPGRLIDLLKMKATNLRRVTFLVLDEADKMFDMGFGQQIASIVGQIRPARQTLLFSGTLDRMAPGTATIQSSFVFFAL